MNYEVDIDLINSIEYYRHIEEDYDEDDDGNLIDVTLYDLVLKDSQDEVLKYADNLTEEDMEDLIGEDLAKLVLTANQPRGYLQDVMSTSVDNLDDVVEVNKVARRLWQTTGYVADARGYILTDGSLLYFGPNVDHMSICWIEGMTVGKFVSLGNIRCSYGSFELEKEPTGSQRAALRELIANSNSNTIYFDIVKYSGSGTYSDNISSSAFKTHNPSIILNQLTRYFNSGIKPDDYYS